MFKSSSSVFGSKLFRPICITASLALLYAGTLAKLGHDWWTDENYSHGLLIPFVIAYILWNDRTRLSTTGARSSMFWGLSMIALALGSLWAGVAGAELYLQRVSIVVMLGGIIVYFWGFRVLRLSLAPLVLLLLAMPIPAIVLNKIAFPLQLFASRCAVSMMRIFEIPVLRQGNVIELMPRGAFETKKLEVVEACSGIRSLMTLVTLAVVYAYFTLPEKGQSRGEKDHRGAILNKLRSYGMWRSAILVVSAVPIAVATNALRVSGTGVLSHYYGTQVADGFFHTFSGWVVYIAAFLLLFALGRTLDGFNRIIDTTQPPSTKLRRKEEKEPELVATSSTPTAN